MGVRKIMTGLRIKDKQGQNDEGIRAIQSDSNNPHPQDSLISATAP